MVASTSARVIPTLTRSILSRVTRGLWGHKATAATPATTTASRAAVSNLRRVMAHDTPRCRPSAIGCLTASPLRVLRSAVGKHRGARLPRYDVTPYLPGTYD